MAQLIQMRQRIKAIETIKKITHAMRLISMSMHSRLRIKMPLLKKYKQEVALLFDKVRFMYPDWINPMINTKFLQEKNELIILVGSQKGLCGNFNIVLFNEFEQKFPENKLKKIQIIAIGKYAEDYLNKREINIIQSHGNLSAKNIALISQEIVKEIVHSKTLYTSVKIISNELKTFFLQRPKITKLIPFEEKITQNKTRNITDDYIWEQKPNKLLDHLAPQYVGAIINLTVFESLLGEQAARFLSMDMANRNAKNLLEETKLHYNKLRQWNITKELTELTTSL